MRYLARIAVMLLAIPALAAAEPLYRWVDEDGTVHYSDKPVEGAEPVELRPLSTFTEHDTRMPRDRDGVLGEPAPAVEYSEARITAPEHDAVVWVTGGLMTVAVASEPPLQQGHQVAVYVNGQIAVGAPADSAQVRVTGMIRGTHELSAAILDADGNTLIRTDTITIHARAHSIHNPQRKR